MLRHAEAKKPAPKRPFLKQGQGIARFGLRNAHLKLKKRTMPQQQQQQQRQQQQQQQQYKEKSGPATRKKHQQRLDALKSVSTPHLQALESPAGILAGQDGAEVKEREGRNEIIEALFCSLAFSPLCL